MYWSFDSDVAVCCRQTDRHTYKKVPVYPMIHFTCPQVQVYLGQDTTDLQLPEGSLVTLSAHYSEIDIFWLSPLPQIHTIATHTHMSSLYVYVFLVCKPVFTCVWIVCMHVQASGGLRLTLGTVTGPFVLLLLCMCRHTDTTEGSPIYSLRQELSGKHRTHAYG